MFERPHHRRIATILSMLDADLLAGNGCLFGGGTAIALRHGEYRESVDIDFLVSDPAGYRALRQRLTGAGGIRTIARAGAPLEATREVRADQYGIRTLLRTEGADLKFEIVSEGRIALEAPTADDRICGVATLTRLDIAATKLLANSDRWADDAAMSRDLIDLAMMAPAKDLLRHAVAKSAVAYGDAVTTDLGKAIEALRARPSRLDRCMEAMQMTTVPKALLWKRIKALGKNLAAALLALMMGGAAVGDAAAQPPWVAKLQAELHALDAQGPIRIGAYVRDLDTGESASHLASQQWYLASMVKVPVAIAVLRGIERGRYTLDTTVELRASDYVDGAGRTNNSPAGTFLPIRFLLEQMIIHSDNTATDLLLDLAGAAEVNALAESLAPAGFGRISSLGEVRRLIYGHLVPSADRLSGIDLLYLRNASSDARRLQLLALLTDTPVARFGLPSLDAAYDAYFASGLNSGRLDAFGELLEALAGGRALTPPTTAHLLDLMERAATGPKRIKAGLPPHARFAHKTGTQRRRVCDAGLVRWLDAGLERRAVIVACTRDERILDRAESALMQVGAAVCRSGLLTNGVPDAPACPAGALAHSLPPSPRR